MDTETSSTKLQDLNEDCLCHISQYLSFEDKIRFHKVCSKWTHVSSGFWRISQFGVFYKGAENYKEYLNLMPNRKLNFDEFREIVLSCGPTFQKLFIWLDNPRSRPTGLVYSFDGTAFFIDRKFSYEATLDVLVEACCNLKTLEIYASVGHQNLSEKFHALFLANENLSEVHLDCNAEADLDSIVRWKDVHGPAKTLFLHLDISQLPIHRNVFIICDLLESNRVNLKSLIFKYRNSEVAKRLVQAVMNYAKNLRVIELRDSRAYHEDSVRYTKQLHLGLVEIAALGDLEELSISSTVNITNEIISAITNGCGKLKKVKLSDVRIGNEDITTLMTSLPTLVSVSLRCLGITSFSLGKAQWTIQSLELDHCSNVSEDEFEKIAVFPNLEELSIDNENCRTITDRLLLAISIGCRKLKKVTLKNCDAITDDGMNTLMTTLPMLESVAIHNLRIYSIIRTNAKSSVRSLDIDCCRHLSKSALKNIIFFKNLEVLRLRNLHTASDEDLSIISFGCKKLKTVTLLFCPQLTSEGINTLIKALPNLETLELIYQKQLSTFFKNVQESNLQRLLIIDSKDFPSGGLKTILSKMPKLKHVEIN